MAFLSLAIFVGISLGSLVSAGLNGDITTECHPRPKFEVKTIQALADVGTGVNKPMDDGRESEYNKAHVLPWTFIRTKVCGEFNEVVDERTKTEKDLQTWQGNVRRFNEVIHTIDAEWVDYGKMDRKQKAAYEQDNKKNKENCDLLISRVEFKNKGNSAIVSSVLAVAKCMNSAPANLRPGFADTNREIADNLDAMLKRRVAVGVGIQESDLTVNSKRLHEKYSLEYPMYVNGGIMSSDQIKKGNRVQ